MSYAGVIKAFQELHDQGSGSALQCGATVQTCCFVDRAFVALPRLEELGISEDRSFANADCRKPAKLTSLEVLLIDGNPISNSGFRVRISPPLLSSHDVSLLMCWRSTSSRCTCGCQAFTLF